MILDATILRMLATSAVRQTERYLVTIHARRRTHSVSPSH